MEAIIDQLKEYCDCFPELNAEEIDEEKLEKNLKELIDLISIITCWKSHECDTFLVSERKEIFDAKKIDLCDCCEDGVMIINPHYNPLFKDTFNIEIVTRNGLKDIVDVVNADDWHYSEYENELRINLKNYVDAYKCGCETISKVVITYQAGYELLPDCLLKLFCDLLHIIYNKNDCGCDKCTDCKNNDVDIDFGEDDFLNPKLNRYLESLIETSYKRLLEQISLCKCTNHNIWWLKV